jgi:vancomycin resistance protein YoaR
VARSTRRDQPSRESEGGRVVLLTVLGLALLAGAVYAGAYLLAGDKVPVGTRVAGVDIGGHRPAAAEVVLRDGLAGRADAPFTVRVAGRVEQVPPRRVGLDVDYSASVRAAGTMHSWKPSQLWAYYTAGGEVSPVVVLDQDRLAALVEQLDSRDGRSPADGSVVFGRDAFHVRPPRAGLSVDPKAAGQAFWSAYLSDDPQVDLTLTTTEPDIGERAVARFVTTFANPAMSSAVTLQLGRRTVRLEPSWYSSLLRAHRVEHHLEPDVDAAGLARLVDEKLGGPDPVDAPRDATVALVGGSPQVVKARRGVVYAPSAIRQALLAAIASDRRTARVHARVADASFTDADARRLAITQRLSSFSVHLPAATPTGRLSAAAARLDGIVLHPGDSLSLRDRLGAALPDDETADALATATFNAAWLGGLRITSHATHATNPGQDSTTGPLGRDATLGQGQDLAFLDDSRYGVLVSVASHAPTARRSGEVTVTLWSTPRWTVTAAHDTPTDVVPAGQVVGHGRGCVARDGAPGLRVTVTRTFTRPGSGEPDRTGSYAAHYHPRPAVVCR